MKNKIILVGFGIIIVASMISTIWYVYKNSPQIIGLNTAVRVDSEYVGEVSKIDRVIKDYYDVYEKTIDTDKRTDEGKKIVQSGVYEIYNQENRVTNKFIDTQKAIQVSNSDPDEIGLGYNHITCSQDSVHISKIDVIEVVPVANASPMTLRALARVFFVNGGSLEDTGYYVEVGLLKQNEGRWLIDTIECKSVSEYVPSTNDKIIQGIVKDKNIKSLPVFKLTHIEASEEITNSAMDYPRTKVQVQYGSKIYDLNTYIGHFANGDKGNWTKLTGEVAGIISWYGGAGDELRIIDKGDKYIVLHKEMEAETGYESGYTEVKVLEGKR